MSVSKNKEASVDQIMTKNPVCVNPETPLTQAVEILVKNKFSGLPVIDDGKRVIGILSDFDLMVQGAPVHLPTLFRLLNDFDVYKKDKKFLNENVRQILSLKVKDAMNQDFISIENGSSITKVMDIFASNSKANPLSVVDTSGKITGIITRHDLARLIGSPYSFSMHQNSEREMDRNIKGFLSHFERKFVFISKLRTIYWFALSIFFVLLGFIIAFAIIVRINNLQ